MKRREIPCITCVDRPCESYLNEDNECWYHSGKEKQIIDIKKEEKKKKGKTR